MFAVMQAVLDLRLHDHMTCKIVARDMPLLAIDQITIAALFCGGSNGRGIRPGVLLGNRVTEMSLAAGEGHHVAGDLIGTAGFEHPALRFAIAPAECIIDAAELFDDSDFWWSREGEATLILGHIH